MMDKSLLMNLNGPWSNTACMGYCLIAMRRAGVNVKTQEKVLRELELSFDGVSIEDAEKAGLTQEGTGVTPNELFGIEPQDSTSNCRFQTFNP